jgi:hypothetical protein
MQSVHLNEFSTCYMFRRALRTRRPSSSIKPATVAPRYTRNRFFFHLDEMQKLLFFFNIAGKFLLPLAQCSRKLIVVSGAHFQPSSVHDDGPNPSMEEFTFFKCIVTAAKSIFIARMTPDVYALYSHIWKCKYCLRTLQWQQMSNTVTD